MSAKSTIHSVIDDAQFRRIETDERRSDLCDGGASTFRKSGKVCRPERTYFAVSAQTCIRSNGYNGTIEDLHVISA
jgi:hypothetical protein